MVEIILAVVLWLLFNVTHAEYCSVDHTDCDYGCCGSGFFKTCCSSDSLSFEAVVGIGCGISFTFIITCYIIICCSLRCRGRQYPQQTQLSVTNTSTQPAAQPYSPFQYGMTPTQYGGPGTAYSPAASQQTPPGQPWPASQLS